MEFNKIKGGYNFNVDTNRYGNEYDYAEFDTVQMQVTLCSVPYDVGEIHIGNRSIGGRGNVVGWESETQRDEYFSNKEDKLVFSTKFRRYHAEDTIILPVPFYAITKYNYIIVEHEEFPTRYGDSGEIRKFFYFVRDMKMLSPNSTEVTILRDDWTTYVCRVDFAQFSMVRGHYANAHTDVQRFLNYPIGNSEYLLEYPMDMVERQIVAKTEPILFNTGECLAVFALSSDVRFTSDFHLSPLDYDSATDSAHGLELLGIRLEDFGTLLENMNKSLFRSIRWCAIMPEALVTKGETLVLYDGSVTAWVLSTSAASKALQLRKEDFGYPERYADLAKLYTYPYAEIELVDTNGAAQYVRIENTNGSIEFNGVLSAMLDAARVSVFANGIGGNPARYAIKALQGREVYIGGNYLRIDFDFPTFSIMQSGYDSNEVDTKADRDARSAIVATNNAAAAGNTAISNGANNANTATANSALTSNTQADNALMFNNTTLANYIIEQTCLSEINAAYEQGSISTTSNVLSGMSAVAGSLGFDVGAGSSEGISGIVSSVTNTFSAGSNSASVTVASNLKSELAYYHRTQNTNSTANTMLSNNTKRDVAIDANDSVTATSNAAATAITANNAQANSDNAATTNSGILAQGGVAAAVAYGTDNEQAALPIGVFANIKTANRDEIRRAGDDFLRYGYPFSGIIQFDTFNVMPKFSYWQVDDMWTKPSGLPDRALDGIRFLLMGGVTIWRAEYIDQMGTISIYDNREE